MVVAYLLDSPLDWQGSVSRALFSVSLSLKRSAYLTVTLRAKEQLEILALGLGDAAPRFLGAVADFLKLYGKLCVYVHRPISL